MPSDSLNKAYVVFLFKNGIYKEGYISDTLSARNGTISLEESLIFDDDKMNFGIYRIKYDSIEIYKWDSRYFNCPLNIINCKGIIENDSSFQLSSILQIDNYKIVHVDTSEIPVIYRFHQYSPKPDSIVSFIP